MCAIVSFDVRPLNVALTWSVCAVGSSITVAVPVAGVVTGGTSLAPLRSPTNVMGTAGAGVGCSARAAKPSKPNERYFISASSLRNLPDRRRETSPCVADAEPFCQTAQVNSGGSAGNKCSRYRHFARRGEVAADDANGTDRAGLKRNRPG